MTSDPQRLARMFRDAAPAGCPTPDEDLLADWVDTARRAWPQLAVSLDGFVAHLARHAAALGAEAPNVADLYLAYACASRDAAAIAELEARCLADVRKAIWQVSTADRDDVMQRVRVSLLVGDGAEPGIAKYGGRGSLRGWIRSIALRTAINHARAASREVAMDEADFLELAASAEAPELEPYKRRYRDELRGAFRDAVANLPVRQRNILRHYFIDHLTVDELGALYRVHRATAARWVNDVRAELVAAVRAALAERLGANDVGLRTVIELVASRLELSLERWVGEA